MIEKRARKSERAKSTIYVPGQNRSPTNSPVLYRNTKCSYPILLVLNLACEVEPHCMAVI
jgi:hypothetical protein